MPKTALLFTCLALAMPILAAGQNVEPKYIKTEDSGSVLEIEFNTDILSLGTVTIESDTGDVVPLALNQIAPDEFSATFIPAPVGPILSPAPATYRIRILNAVPVNGGFTPITDETFRFLARRTRTVDLRDSVSPTTGLTTFADSPFVRAEGTLTGRIFPDTIFLESRESGEARGIQIRRPGLDFLDAGEGFLIEVRGRLNDDGATGNLFVTANDLDVSPGRPRAPITPTVRALGDIKEELEGTLVEVTSEAIPHMPGGDRRTPPAYTGNTFYPLSFNGVNGQYYIPPFSPLIGTPIPKGPFKVIGIVVQFDSETPYLENYAIVPRSTQDVIDLTPANAQHWDMYQ
jgi:hypothetical protein